MNLDEITAKLIELRTTNDNHAMTIAPLMISVKDGEMFKPAFKSFAEYCASISYDTSTLYTWMQCYQIPELRQAYTALGALVSKRLVQSYKKLDADVWDRMLETCKTLSSKDACALIKDTVTASKAEVITTETPIETPLTLKQALLEQSRLIATKEDLTRQLAEIEKDLTEVTALVDRLSVSDRSEKDA